MREFRAKLYKVAMVRWVDLPKRSVDALNLPRADIKGGGLGLNALLRFNDDLDRVTLLPGKRGHYKLAFKTELLRGADVDAGDTISFTLAPDTASREPELPAELEAEGHAQVERYLSNDHVREAARHHGREYVWQHHMMENRVHNLLTGEPYQNPLES